MEVKLARNPQSRREVLAKIFDYISELSNYSYYELNDVTNGALEKVISSFDNYAELPSLLKIQGSVLMLMGRLEIFGFIQFLFIRMWR